MLEAFGASDPGCVRGNNEDYFLIVPSLGLYLVADGMGGAQAGEHASKLAAETVREVVKSARAGTRAATARVPQAPPSAGDNFKESAAADALILVGAFQEANRRVMVASDADPAMEGMGTTLVAAMETGNDLLIASVGDSRAYVYENGALRAVTDDQTWVNEVGRRLGLDEGTLKLHPMRHVLTMAIGVGGALSIHYYMVQLKPSALLLMCSDGLHGVVAHQVIENVLRDDTDGHNQLEFKCKALIEAAKEAGGPDNVTCVLLRGAPAWPSPSDHQY